MNNDNYKDGEAYNKQLETKLGSIVASGKDPVQAATNLIELLKITCDTYKFSEVQGTLREEIWAKRDIALDKIKAQKEIMLVYLDKAFDERKGNFEKLFKLMDVAIEKNEPQQLAILADSINKLAASSPFKVLVDSKETMRALSNDKHEWNF